MLIIIIIIIENKLFISRLNLYLFCYYVDPHVAICVLKHWAHHTATKIPFMYSFSGNSAASAPISTLMCLWAIYIVPGSVYNTYCLQQNRETDRGNIHINRSQTHECGNWAWGRAIPFLGIFVSKFRYFVFAVQLDSLRCGNHAEMPPALESMYAAGVAKYIAVSFDTSPATSLYLAGWPRLEFIQTGQLRAAGGHTPQTNPFP